MAQGFDGHSVAEVSKVLKGTDFPADRDALVKQARANKAPKEILAILEGMPEGEFGTIAEVMHGVKESKHD